MRSRRVAGRQASRPLLIGLKVGRMLKRTKEGQRYTRITSVRKLPRCCSCLKDASSETCCDTRIKEEQVDPTIDMYQCSAYNKTYHWQCLLDLECDAGAKQDEVITDDDWACPAYCHLTPTPKKERTNFQSKNLGSDLGAGRTVKGMEKSSLLALEGQKSDPSKHPS